VVLGAVLVVAFSNSTGSYNKPFNRHNNAVNFFDALFLYSMYYSFVLLKNSSLETSPELRWNSVGTPLELLQNSLGTPMELRWTPIELLWNSVGTSMERE
jgi:hypothetical protein